MDLKNVRTRDDFIQYIQENIPEDKLTNRTPEDTADWFVAWVEARIVFNAYSTKDLASVLLDGISPVRNNPEKHKDFFTSFFEDVDFLRKEDYAHSDKIQELEEEAVNHLQIFINEHFGLH